MLSQIADRAELISLLNNTYSVRTKKPLLKIIILNSKIVPEEMLELIEKRYDLKESYFVDLKILDENLFLLRLTKKVGPKVIRGNIVIDTSRKGVWIVITDEKAYFVRFVVERLFDLLYPNISRLYLNTLQVKSLLKEVEKAYDGVVKISHFVVKLEPKPEKLIFESHTKGTVMRWKADPEKELLKLSESHRVIIRNIEFKLYDKYNILSIDGGITRKGICNLKYGYFDEFYKYVVSVVIKTTYKLKQFYGNRERLEKEGIVELRPLQIHYKDIFNKSQLRLLEKKLSSKYLCSIIHGGNPYFAANLLDYKEGSSFGLTVLSNKVTITPIVKASSEATWKLTNTLQEILGDGNIVDVIS